MIVITYDLHNGQVFLPPQIFLHLWAHGRQQIVHVHDYVNERVDETQKCTMTAWNNNVTILLCRNSRMQCAVNSNIVYYILYLGYYLRNIWGRWIHRLASVCDDINARMWFDFVFCARRRKLYPIIRLSCTYSRAIPPPPSVNILIIVDQIHIVCGRWINHNIESP